jgi:hypothetical protein
MEYYRSKVGYCRDAEVSDITSLKDNLRSTTIDELWAVHHFTPEQSLFYSFSHSVFCFSIITDNEVLAMGGILRPQDLLVKEAAIWFLTSQKLDKVERTFLRQCRNFIKTMLELYPVLYNYVDIRNKPAILWLKWIGAEFGEIIPFGVDNRMFQYFTFKKEEANAR